MSSPRWPLVVDYLLDTLPALPGWERVAVFDTDAMTTSTPGAYAVVVRTQDTSGGYSRAIAPSGLVTESGTVRLLVTTRTSGSDPEQVRTDGFTLAAALEAALLADHTLGGILGEAGTVSVTVDVQAVANPTGVAQSLIAAVTYTSLT